MKKCQDTSRQGSKVKDDIGDERFFKKKVFPFVSIVHSIFRVGFAGFVDEQQKEKSFLYSNIEFTITKYI